MSYSLILHDGKAHLDEVLAAALLVLHKGALPDKVERVPPDQAAQRVSALPGTLPENGAEEWFLDCGLVLDPARHLFDHHQQKELDCAALLVFDELFPALKESELHDYLKLVSKVDTGGLMALEDFPHLGESRDYWSFPNAVLLRSFEKDPLPILTLFKEGLEDKIQFAQRKAEAERWLEDKENAGITVIRESGITVLEYHRQPPDKLISPLRAASGPLVDEHKADAVYSFERETGNRILYRTDHGHSRLDFTLAEPANAVFCHAGGFLLKFQPDDTDEWQKLIRESIL